MAPAYISDLINVRKHICYSLNSNSATILLHPAGKVKTLCDRSVSVAAPTRGNTLPVSLRNTDSIVTLNLVLKHIFLS